MSVKLRSYKGWCEAFFYVSFIVALIFISFECGKNQESYNQKQEQMIDSEE